MTWSRMMPRLFRCIGELVITAGVLWLGFTAYQMLGESAVVTYAQHRLGGDLERVWRSDGATTSPEPTQSGRHRPVRIGAPFVRLAIPALGQRWTVVEGVDPTDLRTAPGHYPSTANPGELGNFAVAGHRSGGLFLDLDRVVEGALVTVETRESVFTYRVYRTEVVLPDDMRPIAPNPDTQYKGSPRALLTLTTCEPKWSNSHRLIVHAELTRVRHKP
jgi:sortase A